MAMTSVFRHTPVMAVLLVLSSACTDLTGTDAGGPGSGPDVGTGPVEQPTPAPALRNLYVASGASQWANRGAPVARPIVVRTSDPSDRPIAGVRITFRVSAGGGTLADTMAVSDTNGFATVPRWTLGPGDDTQTLVAAAGRVTLRINAFVLERGMTTPYSFTFVRDGALFEWRAGSTGPTRLLDVGPMLGFAALSRDGATAAVTEYGDNAESVCIVDLPSARRRCITPDSYANLYGLALSPDGSQLLLTGMPFVRCGASRCVSPRSDLLRLDVPTMVLTQVRPSTGPGGYVTGSSWSPDGRRITYVTDGTVYVANADGSDPRSVPLIAGGALTIRAVRFSPDGSQLALLLWDENACPFDCETLVGVADAAGGPVRLLRREDVSVYVSQLVWSPDGRRLSYTTITDESPVRSNAMVVPIDGGAPEVLLRGAVLLDWR